MSTTSGSRGGFESQPQDIILDPNDIIDWHLAIFRLNVNAGRLPSTEVQRQLIIDTKRGNKDRQRDFINMHWGLIAAAVYPFKNTGVTSEGLLIEGAEEFLETANAFDMRADDLIFYDVAVAAIRDRFGQRNLAETSPMAGILALVSRIASW